MFKRAQGLLEASNKGKGTTKMVKGARSLDQRKKGTTKKVKGTKMKGATKKGVKVETRRGGDAAAQSN